MGAEPARVMAAAGKIPRTGQAEPARDGPQFGWPDRSPGDNAIWWTKDFSRHVGIEKGGNHRAAVRLFDTPGGAGIMAGDLLDDLDVGHRIKFGAAEGTRLQQAEQS